MTTIWVSGQMQPSLTISGEGRRRIAETMGGMIIVLTLGLFAAATLTPTTPAPGEYVACSMPFTAVPVTLETTVTPMPSPSLAMQDGEQTAGRSLTYHPDAEILSENKVVMPVRQVYLPPPDTPTRIILIAVGDVMLGRQVNLKMVRQNDFTWPFREMSTILRGADLTLGNLENTIISGCHPTDGGDVLCADPRSVEGLTWAGFDGLSLANNHSHDYGEAGFQETTGLLAEAGIDPICGGTVVIHDIEGIRVGILSFDDSEMRLDLDHARATVEEASRQVDVLIGLIHWGVEYRSMPSERQREVGHALVNAGVDVVIGTHPHWVQPTEGYNGGLIVYSLGNFVFDQLWSEPTREGEIIRLTLIKDGNIVTFNYDLLRVRIYDFWQTLLMN